MKRMTGRGTRRWWRDILDDEAGGGQCCEGCVTGLTGGKGERREDEQGELEDLEGEIDKRRHQRRKTMGRRERTRRKRKTKGEVEKKE
jgi:hypothetical protein